jgi:hypothetical protein
MNRTYSTNDYHHGFQNNQEYKAGTAVIKDATMDFFITSILGTDVQIEDKDGNALFTVSDFDFAHPFRLDGGFEIAGGTNPFVIYYKMPKGNA